MANKKTLINFIVEEDLLKRIEDFRFKNRFPTRAAAIKWLLDWAMKQKPSLREQVPEFGEDYFSKESLAQNQARDPNAEGRPGGNAVGELQDARGAAMSALLDLVLTQQASDRGQTARPEQEPPPLSQVMNPGAKSEPAPAASRESITQALRDQGYEVGEVARHPDGQERILVRSQDRSAWVNVVQELQDLAAARITLAEVADRRRAAGR